MRKIKTISTIIKSHPERIILLSGAGQNVGKTTFACELIRYLKALNHQVYTLKISPHFHDESPPNTIFSDERFILSLEKQRNNGKDTARMKEAGADEVFFLQVKDEFLAEAFNYTLSFMPPNVLLLIESGGLRKILNPALFFFLERLNMSSIKENTKRNRLLADKVIVFDGQRFDFQLKNIKIIGTEIKLNV
ncbi:MAG: hypothetical protein KAH25_02720 [Bacteroidales bacterium]|nr:hypothetical protein [Bacteroidales bacterium]